MRYMPESIDGLEIWVLSALASMVWCFWERGAVLCRNKECSIRGEEEEHWRACRIERDDGRRGEKERIGRDEDGKIERERGKERGKFGWKKERGVRRNMVCGTTYQTPSAECVRG